MSKAPPRPVRPASSAPPPPPRFRVGDIVEMRARVIGVGPWPGDKEAAITVQMLNQDASVNTRVEYYPVVDASVVRLVRREP